MSEELKPCPFCGGIPQMERTVTDASVWCRRCGGKIVRLHAVGVTVDSDAVPWVIAAWNRRVLHDPTP